MPVLLILYNKLNQKLPIRYKHSLYSSILLEKKYLKKMCEFRQLNIDHKHRETVYNEMKYFIFTTPTYILQKYNN